MIKKENSRSIIAATEREKAAALGGAAAFNETNHITASKPRQVADVLPVGAANAVDGKTLAAIMGYRTLRVLSREIQRERAAGQPICASVAGERRGYYLAATPGEFSAYIQSLDRRIHEVRKTRDSCGASLRKMIEQEIVEGW